ncbi:MAG: FAD-dependent oxidoreductase [Myxococcales bacterium]|nr:FAD-dependent oxidoreductase [Myxococcales bacterium]
MPTRRDVLATFLGAAFAGVACKSKAPVGHYHGELFGPRFDRGHKLRDPKELAATLARTDLPEQKTRVVVVGGGPAGLSAAWRLIRGGLAAKEDVQVFELDDVAGGTSRGGQSEVTRYPWGAHYVPVPSGDARALGVLLEEMGIVEGHEADGYPVIAEHVLCRAPEERLFYRGRWYEGLYLQAGAQKEDLRQFRAFKRELQGWRKWRDLKGRRAFVIPTARASDAEEVLALDAVSMAQWMDQKGFTSARLRWLVDYACRDDYALSLQDASAWAGLFYFVSRMNDLGASSELMTWADGNGGLVRHLLGVVADRVHLGKSVIDVRPRGAQEQVVTYLDRDGAPHRLIAERVILAVPRYVARHLCPSLADRKEDLAFDYGAWAVCNVHLNGRGARPQGVAMAWDNVLYESPSLGYVSATHQEGNDHGPTVWTWYYAITDPGKDARKKLLDAHWRDWADVAFSDLSRAHPDLHALADRIDVFRWGHAMTRPRVGARRALREAAAHVPVGAVHFAHTDLSGVAIFEEAHDHGVRAAEEVLAALSFQVPSIR